MFCRHLNHETDRRHADHIVEKGAQVFVNHCNAGTVATKPAASLHPPLFPCWWSHPVSSGCLILAEFGGGSLEL